MEGHSSGCILATIREVVRLDGGADEEGWFWALRAVLVRVWQVSAITFIRLLIYFVHVVFSNLVSGTTWFLPCGIFEL